MNKTPWYRLITLLFKTSVFIVACFFIYQVVLKNLSTLKALEIQNPYIFTASIFGSIIIYVILMMSLALSWLTLLRYKYPEHCAKIYFKSQVLKYLPGNVLHFAYRHNKTNKIGFAHKQLLKVGLFEVIGLIVAASLVSNALLLWPNQIPWITNLLTFLYLPSWLIVFLELLILASLIHILKIKSTYTILLCYLVYFFGMGLIAQTLAAVMGFVPQAYLFITSCFAVSWLAGYVIPGAPGGMGVRELVFILLTSPQITEVEALVLISIIRLISISAEAVIFIIAPKISQPYRHLAAWSDKTML